MIFLTATFKLESNFEMHFRHFMEKREVFDETLKFSLMKKHFQLNYNDSYLERIMKFFYAKFEIDADLYLHFIIMKKLIKI